MDEIDIDKISRLLLQPVRNLALKVHIKLLHEKEGRKENFHNLFTMKGNKYLKIDLQSFLTLELNDGQWARDKSIIIDQKNIFQLIKGFKRVLDGIYNGNIFAMTKSKEIVIYKEQQEKYTEKIFNLGGVQKIIVRPAIIYDDTDVSYEGVVIHINRYDNFVELPIDAFEALLYTMEKVDLFVYSQQLLNYYMSCVKDQKVELKETTIEPKNVKTKKQHVLFTQEDVKSTLVKESSPEEFFDFKKEEDTKDEKEDK